MENDFRLKLFGSVVVEQGGTPLSGFKSRKVVALLGYLAAQGHPVERSYLASLFWTDSPESRARNNLSQATHNLLSLLPDCLVTDRQTVQFCPSAAVWVDINAFEKFADIGDAPSLEQAVELYQGDFMNGLYLDGCPEFEQWLRLEQESWHQRVIRLQQNLIDFYAERNMLERALEFSSRLLTLDPAHEEAHCQRMLLLAKSGQRSAALAQYRLCREILGDDLNVEPAMTTTELYEQIKAGKFQPKTLSNAPPAAARGDGRTYAGPLTPGLPVVSTSFIGRATELAVIEKQLQNPNCRLLNIVGMGGIGKTRLAIQAAGSATGFEHGVGFVSLVSVSSAAYIVSTLAETLKIPLYGYTDPKAQLVNQLRDKRILLVMDNFEHLLSGAGVLSDILRDAPHVKFLVTSRERLGLYEEWVLDLRGLPFPESGQDSLIDKYSATQLFIQRAQQVRADFWLTYRDKPAIARICRLVEGMPLGIELAAAWTRTLSCQDIATEIEKNYSFLSSSPWDISRRHGSLQAVFEHSWQLLSPEEQQVFKKLTVFWGGFTRYAAEWVAGASAQMLAALVDKSLITRTGSDRYEIHELVRQFAAEKLAGDAEARMLVKNLHARYYADFLQTQETLLKRGKQSEVLKAVGEEIDNIRAGWNWVVEKLREREFKKYREGLFLFHNVQSWFADGEELFDRAAKTLRGLKGRGVFDQKIDRMLGQVLARQGVLCASLGQYDKARDLMQSGLAIFQHPDIRQQSPLSLNYYGAIAWALGEYVAAKQLCQESLATINKLNDHWKKALVLQYLGMISISLGEYLQARSMAEECLTIFKQFGYRSGIAFSLNMYGIAARNLGDYASAKKSCEEGLALAREIGDRWEEALALQYLGLIAVSLGQFAETKTLARQSQAIYQQLGYKSGVLFALDLQGIAARNLGNYDTARQLHTEVLETSRAMDYPLGIALATYYLGRIAYLTGDHHEAEQLLTESLTLAKKQAYPRGVSASLQTLGHVAFALGKNQQAKQYLYDALRTAQTIHATPMTLEILTQFAYFLIEEGESERAVKLLVYPLRHEASKKETKETAQRLFADIKPHLPEHILKDACEQGRPDSMDEFVEEILSATDQTPVLA